jgi:hypothetical protein
MMISNGATSGAGQVFQLSHVTSALEAGPEFTLLFMHIAAKIVLL